MKVLITGVCGFVGHWIAKVLTESDSGIQLVGIDNLSRSGSQSNLPELKRRGVRFIHGDLRCASDLEVLPSVDWVIDCAAMPSVLAGTLGNGSARQLLEHNLVGSLNLLEYCRIRCAGLILLSTSRVYSLKPLSELPLLASGGAYQLNSAEENLPPGVSADGIEETFSTLPPVSLYGATKVASETIACEYAAMFNFPLRINRCGVLAGAGQFGRAEQGIFSYWIHSHFARQPLKYIGAHGTGFQVRDCLHPLDVATLISQQINAGDTPGKPTIVNVSGGIESAYSLYQLTQWCDRQFSPHKVESTNENRPFDLPWIVLNNKLAQSHWQWEPSRSTEQILDEIATHARANPDWLKCSR
ncbi:NAD-dependent epimerase/dehydratase family protein [Neorhodopirellula pilleata]|uniref:CDP-paratose 2-epimerase n=1 Tax=Neorhodopirellula pilleata TaxID=2714738 RepID=A0A5C6AT47_9BACT|nr:NAD-dependent epimerase/dehydratase family protein [Neorhodopirellula pilleata]TWU03175.1 CDP-paratose 2-epimerase [Neorhodopirellula pilleata]